MKNNDKDFARSHEESGSENKNHTCLQLMSVPRPTRKAIESHIEFIGDFDIVSASGVDLSEGGICFDVTECLPFEMRFEMDGVNHHHRAKLVWMRRLTEGGYRFGFEFLPPSESEQNMEHK